MITKIKSNSFEWLLLTVSFWLYFSLKIVTPTSVTAASSFHQELHYYHHGHTSNWKGRQIIFCIRGGGIDTDWENDDNESTEQEEALWKRPFRFHMQAKDEIQSEHQLEQQLKKNDNQDRIINTATASLRLIPDSDDEEEEEDDDDVENEYDEDEYEEEYDDDDDEEEEFVQEEIARKNKLVLPLKKESSLNKKTPEPKNILKQTQPSIQNQPVNKDEENEDLVTTTTSKYMSSGYWSGIDSIVSLGMANSNPQYRLSTKLYHLRKKTAQITGLHGFLSGKHSPQSKEEEEKLGQLRRRLSAIQSARERVLQRADIDSKRLRFDTRDNSRQQRKENANNYPIWRRVLFLPPASRKQQNGDTNATTTNKNDNEGDASEEEEVIVVQMTEEEKARQLALQELQRVEELQRQKRVQEIDSLILDNQNRLLELQCQKDILQRRPNPFYQYNTTTSTDSNTANTNNTSREFEFPPSSLVKEYIDHLISQKRLIKLNHTELWKQPTNDEENGSNGNSNAEEQIGDDLLTPSADAHKLYTSASSTRSRKKKSKKRKKKHSNTINGSSKSDSKRQIHTTKGNGNGHSNGNGNSGGGGSWLLRSNLLGGGVSLGEKIGEVAENAAYEGVCSSIMMVLARSISALHGINVMAHSDVRLTLHEDDDDDDDLPPNKSPIFSQTDYAEDTIRKVIRKSRSKNHPSKSVEFLQRDAVVETLLSHCQISAPLLKLFPLGWQRAMLGNIITLIAAVVSDFADGIHLQILGHRMTFEFKPITSEADLLLFQLQQQQRQIQKSKNPYEFEAAVKATAQDISDSLAFLDRWHERALGSGMLRAQIANLIARLVLTLVDEVLHGAKMDLWSNQVPGSPRVLAGLEHRTSSQASAIRSVNTKINSPST